MLSSRIYEYREGPYRIEVQAVTDAWDVCVSRETEPGYWETIPRQGQQFYATRRGARQGGIAAIADALIPADEPGVSAEIERSEDTR